MYYTLHLFKLQIFYTYFLYFYYLFLFLFFIFIFLVHKIYIMYTNINAMEPFHQITLLF